MLDEKTTSIVVLAALLGCGDPLRFPSAMKAAQIAGVSPVEIKEIAYQAVDYLGISRIYPFLTVINRVLEDQKIPLPLPGQETTHGKNRREAGANILKEVFGYRTKVYYRPEAEESRHIHNWMMENCFGACYTRTGLSYQQRELITFCLLAAQGDCDTQLKRHAAANMRIGNDKATLIDAIHHCRPYIGIPYSLDALACVNSIAQVE